MRTILKKAISICSRISNKGLIDIVLFSILSFYLSIFITAKNVLQSGTFNSAVIIAMIFGMCCLFLKHVSLRMLLIFVIVAIYDIVAKSYLAMAVYKNNNHFIINTDILQPTVLLLAALLGLLILILIVKKNVFKKSRQSNSTIVTLLLSQTFAVMAMSTTLFTHMVKQNNYWPIDNSSSLYSINLFKYSFCSFVLMFLVYYLIIKAINDILNQRFRLKVSIAMSLLLAIIFNYYIQSGITTYGDLHGLFIIPGATLFQVIILTLLFVVLYLITNNFITGSFLSIFTGILIGVINLEKYRQRSEPLLFSDLKWIKEIKFFLSYISLVQIITIISAVLVSIASVYFLRQKFFKEPVVKLFKIRILSLATIIIVFLSIFSIFSNHENGKIKEGIPVLSSVYNVFDIDWYGLTTNARFQSLSFVWFKQVTTSTINKPQNYNKKSIKKIYQKYNLLARDINKTRENNISNQTIIYILSESFADPYRIKNISLSKDPIPEIRKIIANTTGGLMHSDGYGGGTANMEFQSLFGLPKYNLNQTVSILYSDVFPKLKYSPSISNEFLPENRIAIHLANANNYSRKIVYDKLNFSKFIATENSKQKPKFLTRVSSSYSDESTYQNILDTINPNKSQFFSVITMQNHGPWYTEERDISASIEGLNRSESDSLQNYVNLMRITDQSTKSFLEELEKIDKSITVVFYGDHLPGFYPENIFNNNKSTQFLTDYFIWSNKGNNKKNRPYVNSSDFTPLLLEHTNSKVSPYYALLTEILEDRNNQIKSFSKIRSQASVDLKLIQYDLIEGKGYLQSYPDFFKIN